MATVGDIPSLLTGPMRQCYPYFEVPMPLNARKSYLFGDFELKIVARVLTRDGKQIPLGSKAFEVLTCLVMRAGEVVSKDELLQAAWPDAFVEEGNLTQQISALRKALGECAGYIVTIAGKGYQFTAEVRPEMVAQPFLGKPAGEGPVPRAHDGANLFVVESRTRTSAQAAKAPEEEFEVSSAGPAEPIAEKLQVGTKIVFPPSTESDEKQCRAKSRRVLWWLGGAFAVVLLSATAYVIVARRSKPPFEHFTIERANDRRHVPKIAISPDGAYLASVITDVQDSESLWVHHLATGSEQPILQNAAMHYLDVTFSPDGSFIYFRIPALGDKPIPVHRTDVYRIPILGGTPSRILENVDAQVGFIDSGRRLCFYRQNVPTNYLFLSAAADGGDERVLFTGKPPYPIEAACAPDGRRAVVEDSAGKIEILDFGSGSKRTLFSSDGLDGNLLQLRWHPTGKGIFAVQEKNSQPGRQIAFLSYPGGIPRQITNDLNDYIEISLTANAKMIAATQMERNSRFEEISLEGPARIEEHKVEGLFWFTWVDGHTILTLDREGVFNRVDLTDDKQIYLNVAKEHSFIELSLCGASAFVASGRGPDEGGLTRNIYKMRLDGSAVTQVTRGSLDLFPECTSDGRWLFYTDNRDRKSPSLMRVSLKSGAAQRVTGGSWFHNVSPNGNLLADVSDDGSKRLRVFSTETLQEIQSFPLPADADNRIAFSADSQGVFYYYVNQAKREASIWRQPLDGLAAVMIARVPGRVLYWMRPSPDGTKLGLTTMTMDYRSVLLRDVP